MNLKTYQGATMGEALAEVKRDLGRDAVIVETRSFRKGGLLGLIGGRSVWEVTACPHTAAPPRPVGTYVASEALREMREKQPVELAPAAPSEPATPLDREMAQLRSMVQALLEMHTAGQAPDLPEALCKIRSRLLQQEVREEIVEELICCLRRDLTGEQLADRASVLEELGLRMAGKIATAPTAFAKEQEHKPRILAFIGPTGVGKTTTIAKLAANFKLRDGKRVGLVTIDTYRIAAVDQLKTYAEIIDVPLEVVLTPGELRQAVWAMSDTDVVLIDTAGRSQRDQLRLNQLSAFLTAAAPDEVHLVLSATANRTCVANTLEQFAPLGVNRIVVTKLDEAVTYGLLLNVSAAVDAPLSYVTTGQDVPDDIAPADPLHLVSCILGGDPHVAP